MTDVTSPRSTVRLWIGAYLIATFGTAALFKAGVISGWPGPLLIAVLGGGGSNAGPFLRRSWNSGGEKSL